MNPNQFKVTNNNIKYSYARKIVYTLPSSQIQ